MSRNRSFAFGSFMGVKTSLISGSTSWGGGNRGFSYVIVVIYILIYLINLLLTIDMVSTRVFTFNLRSSRLLPASLTYGASFRPSSS
ncbi:hypothetical protein ATCV1_z768R [Acanthocystis turfacea chlorella virus 1]|uniref:Uncharacterized protein z768R n=1 Tax=Chlorovirus heliozoae TaxID=322019 RepID=A7KA28_9PHYC|nr:hypothetical protein ATCV1_z768R [Acanthocystis turfacea chlorella virus 1]ABT16902.1 hypothetical protein ATCV1_z768R [Acanthocystis turfacea chlorella virus 1]